jgi:hypothetical protein
MKSSNTLNTYYASNYVESMAPHFVTSPINPNKSRGIVSSLCNLTLIRERKRIMGLISIINFDIR